MVASPKPALRWDVYCRVIDNFGDIGVCLRLARQLCARGDTVRLHADDLSAVAWMAPPAAAGAVRGLTLHDWPAGDEAPEPGDVVVEAFACDPPAAVVARMAAAPRAPVWVNLEYLSAEAWVQRVHGLPSPQFHGPGAGLTKWFFHPGFAPGTGGLLREDDWAERLLDPPDAERAATLARLGLQRDPGEQVLLLFCYPGAPVAALLRSLQGRPSLVLAAPGGATSQALAAPAPPGVRVVPLPWLSQDDFDRVLAAADLNFVRGEDSLVRATWAAQPLLWQLYPQHDGAHAAKLQAWLARGPMPPEAAALARWWNGLAAGGAEAPPPPWPERHAWQQALRERRDALLAQPDLATALRSFVLDRAADRVGATPKAG